MSGFFTYHWPRTFQLTLTDAGTQLLCPSAMLYSCQLMTTNNESGAATSHAGAAVLFGLLAVAWTFPLAVRIATHIGGASPADNTTFVWNLWWWRTALRLHLDPFYTNYLFYPLGVDLAQHTHTAFAGLLGATLLGSLSVIAAQNLLLLTWVFLNGFVTYLLAFRLLRRSFPAICAGVVFAGCPAVLVRLEGHFNLVAAWVLPMAILLMMRAVDSRRTFAYAVAGAGMGLVAYCDYYYLVYALVCVVLLLIERWFAVTAIASRRRAARVSTFVACVLALDVCLMTVVLLSGGTELRLGTAVVLLRTTFNLRIAFWILTGCWLLTRWRLSFAISVQQPIGSIRNEAFRIGAAILAFVSVTLPLARHAARLIESGDYSTPRYLWRSAPAGIDLSSLFLGNPLHFLSGSITQKAYTALGMNPMEGIGWLGFVAPILVALGWHRLRSVPEARFWRLVLLVFGVWALGPFFNFFGTTPGIVLPAALVRAAPVVSNARIPGRAVIVAALAVSVLMAMTLASRGKSWSLAGKLALLVVLILEFTPRPLPMYEVVPNRIYTAATAPSDAILELPLGLRDGFGESGTLDHRALLYQMNFQRPMLGGFVARLPHRVKQWYRNEPVVSTLLSLSERVVPPLRVSPPLEPNEAYQVLHRLGVRFVVLNRADANAELIHYVQSVMPLHLVMRQGERELYELQKPR